MRYIPIAEVGLNIKDIRTKKRVSQVSLAAKLGWRPSNLCEIEKGRRMVSLRTLYRIARALGVEARDLLAPRAEGRS